MLHIQLQLFAQTFLGRVLQLFEYASMITAYGLFFFTYNLSYGYPYIAYSLSHIAFVFLITVPILTMRILAEEKKSRTDQLLLTSPVPMIKIMIGKYLALACTYTIAVLIIAI